jgi:hypothetical protein
MKRIGRKAKWLIPIAGLVVVPSILIYRRVEQKRLDPLLIAAVRAGRSASVERLLSEGADPNASEIESAAPDGFIERVKSLFGPRRSIGNREGKTALMLAAGNVDLASVKSLLRAGASVNDRDDIGYTALMYACMLGGQEWDPGKSSVLASTLPLREVIELLLKAGADPNVKAGFERTTALILLSKWTERTDCADALLKHGSDLEGQDLVHATALFHALNSRQIHMAQFLLQIGARVDIYPSLSTPRLVTTSCLGEAINLDNYAVIGQVLDRGGKYDP